MIDKKHIENCFVHQLDTTDCGAACLLSITRYYGGDSSIYHIIIFCLQITVFCSEQRPFICGNG